jgi:HD-like signal output (HDOD) protein
MRKRRLIYLNDPACPRSILAQMFKELREEWETVVTDNLRHATTLMREKPFDALVFDAEQADPERVEFLKETALRDPKMHRFVLTRTEDPKVMQNWSGAATEYLSRQGEARTIESAIRRAFQLERWMQDETLRSLVSQVRRLPSRPVVYRQIMNELQSPDGEIERVAMLIADDPALCAKVLQVVNAAVYALPRQITNAFEAVIFLGLEATKSLVLFAEAVSALDASKCVAFSIEKFWCHCVGTASYARWIALAERDDKWAGEEAYTAGLLHDAGRLMLAANFPERYNAAAKVAEQKGIALRQAEQETLGATHAELGACVLAKWGLPYAILEAMAWHHEPRRAPRRTFLPLTAVHVANILEHQRNPQPGSHFDSDVDSDYLQNVGLAGHLTRWLEICGK